jgi:hypothetical protein
LNPRGLPLLGAAIALAAAAPAAAHLARADDWITTPDAAGDGDPDISRVTSASNGSGGLTFVVQLANRQELGASELLEVHLDVDMNAATGAPGGADFMLQMGNEGIVRLHRWNGSAMAPISVSDGYIYRGFRLATNRSQLTNLGPTLRYRVSTVSSATGDAWPDGGGMTDYVLSTTPLTLRIAQFANDKRVRAGKEFIVAMRVHRDDMNETSSSGIVGCSAKVGKRKVAIQPVFPEDIAGCVGIAPKWAKGKTIATTLSLSLDGKRVSRVAKTKVR